MIAAMVVAVLLGLAPGTLRAEDRPRLIVYLQTSVRSRTLETALQQELPTLSVLVLSRHRDFVREIAARPDAALAVLPVLKEQGWDGELRGMRSGQDTEPYVLLSSGTNVERSQLGQLVLGAVDLLGRERTGAFVAGLLGLPAPPSLKFVMKTEDLLALLQFQSVGAVVLSEQDAAHIKNISKLALRMTPLATRVGLPAVAFMTDRGRQAIKPRVLSLNAETLRKLGVEAWR